MDVAGFAVHFAECRSVREADAVYRDLFHEFDGESMDIYEALSEAHRRALVRITLPDENRSSTAPETSGPSRVRSRELRNWCRQQGRPLGPKGRVPVALENEYRRAHEMPLLPEKRTVDTRGVDNAAVRRWARSQGISVGERGRVHPDVIQKFRDANEKQATDQEDIS